MGLIRGALAGAVATWVMDQVTQAMLDAQPAAVTAREEAARVGGQGSVPNLVDRLERALGLRLGGTEKDTAAQAIHYALGVVPGAMYGLLRHRVPLLGAGGGLVYGFSLWVLADEYANVALGLSGPPEAYPTETHLRGLVGHLVLGAITDSGIDLLGG